jgi:hypothetical protein
VLAWARNDAAGLGTGLIDNAWWWLGNAKHANKERQQASAHLELASSCLREDSSYPYQSIMQSSKPVSSDYFNQY